MGTLFILAWRFETRERPNTAARSHVDLWTASGPVHPLDSCHAPGTAGQASSGTWRGTRAQSRAAGFLDTVTPRWALGSTTDEGYCPHQSP